MNRTQFWILNATVIVAGLLFLAEIFISRQINAEQQKFAYLQRTMQEGNGYYTRWQNLALRTYQLSQQDPALKEVLVRQQIKITPKTTPGGSSTAPVETSPVSQSSSLPKTPVKK